MYPFYLELELIKPVSDYFKNQGYLVKHETRIGFCRADLVGFKDDKVGNTHDSILCSDPLIQIYVKFSEANSTSIFFC